MLGKFASRTTSKHLPEHICKQVHSNICRNIFISEDITVIKSGTSKFVVKHTHTHTQLDDFCLLMHHLPSPPKRNTKGVEKKPESRLLLSATEGEEEEEQEEEEQEEEEQEEEEVRRKERKRHTP